MDSATATAYGVVILRGVAVGIAEVISTFSSFPTEALKTGWAWGLVALNALAAVLVLFIVRYYTGQSNPIMTALAVGVGLPTLVRTKFTLAKQFGGTEGNDLSINLGWLYDQFLYVCKVQIDLVLLQMRRKLIHDLLMKIRTPQESANIAHQVIVERALFSQEDVQRRQEYVNGILQSTTIPDSAKSVGLARFIFETGGRDYVEALIESS